MGTQFQTPGKDVPAILQDKNMYDTQMTKLFFSASSWYTGILCFFFKYTGFDIENSGSCKQLPCALTC
jgi:hypothetical protein